MRKARLNGIGLVALLLLIGCKGDPGSGDPATRERRASALVGAVATGRYDEARADFNLIMSMSLSEGRLREVWEGLTRQTGPFTNTFSTNATRQAGYEVVWLGLGFEHGALRAKVVFDSGDKVTGLFFVPWQGDGIPPTYADPSRFEERQVRFGDKEWELEGTLTTPKGATNPPVVVLVHGSGPHDRDETIGPNKPFRDLAWGLAGRGIAVFRYEKRTKAHQAKMGKLPRLTVNEETVDDAVLAVAAMSARSAFRDSRLFVLGHSLGGHVGPRIAARAGSLDGLIIMAGNVRPLPDLVIEQAEYLSANGGDAKQLEGLKVAAERLRNLTLEDARSREVILGAPMSYWFDLRDYDPVATLKAYGGRVLVLQGERDYQVTPKELERWRDGLRDRTNLTARSFPALNHLMMPGRGRSTPFEYQQPGNVAEDVVAAIAEWIKD